MTLVGLTLVATTSLLAPADDAPDFARDVWPLFERSCVDCHRDVDDDGGPKRPKGELVLTSPKAILAGGRGGAVLVPGDADASSLVHVITLLPDDPDAMPPRGAPITADEAATIAAWIDAGATFGDWSGRPRRAPEPAAEDLGAERVPSRVSLWEELARGLSPVDTRRLEAAREAELLIEPVGSDATLLRVEVREVEGALEHLAALAEHVVGLDLGRSDVDEAFLSRLPPMRRLVRIDLDRTALDDRAVPHLARHRELRVVNLHATDVTDVGLPLLSRLPKLEQVYLWATRVTPRGVERLVTGRPGLEASSVNAAFDAPPLPIVEDERGGRRR